MIKVCHMTSAHKSDDIRIFVKECRSLVEAGYEVNIVATDDVNTVKDGVRIYSVKGGYRGRLDRIYRGAQEVYVKAKELDCDIYHFHDPELIPYAIKLKKIGKIVIYDVHEDYVASITEKQWIPSIFRKTISVIMKKYEESICKKIDGVITVTPHILERLQKYNSNSVIVANYPIINKDYRTSEYSEESNTICFAGGISEQWMHVNIIQALEEIEDIRYTLLGSGDEEYINRLRNLKGWNKVDYVGRVPHNEVKKTLHMSSAGMALNDYVANVGGKRGSLGNTKLFEYMEAGIPVICTDFEMWKEIIDRYNCGVCVNPHNINQIVEAIIYIRNNSKIAAEMGMNGRKAVEEIYNWDREKEKLVSFYNRLNKSKVYENE